MDFMYLFVVLGVILVSMICHELMHGLVAYWLGDDTAKVSGRLSLNPLRHLDPFMSILLPMMLAVSGAPVFGGAKPVPVDSRRLRWGEWGMALVALAGPATNFLIALVAFLFGHFTGMIYESDIGMIYESDIVGLIFLEFVLVNLGFCIFNLLPIPPLDGSRILYAFAPDGVQNAMVAMERYGIIVVFALVVVFGSLLSSLMSGAMIGVLQFFEWIVGV